MLLKGMTTIGHDVWIGCSATFLLGVSIGNGAFVGRHSRHHGGCTARPFLTKAKKSLQKVLIVFSLSVPLKWLMTKSV